MTLPQAGVQLVADGSAAFNTALVQAKGALDSLSTSGQAVAGSLSAFDSVLAPVSRLVDQFASRFLRQLEIQLIRNIEQFVQATAQGTAFAETLKNLGTQTEGIAKYNLAPFWEQFNQLLVKATPGIEAFVNFATKSFADLGSDALVWGENITTQLANGIIAGAEAVLEALTNIGNLIASYLQPGSPPKLLPDLDKWGTAAAQVYLDAWGKADFSTFNDIAGEIEKLLRSQTGTGKKQSTDLIPTIIGTREAIAEAVDQARQFGTVTADALDKIYKAAGATTPQVKDFLKASFDLELANKNLAAAQDNLNNVTKHYDDLLKPVNAQLQALDDQQQNLSDQQQRYALNLVLQDPNATLAEKEQARLALSKIGLEEQKRGLDEQKTKAVDAAQAQLDAATAAQKQAQAEYDAKKGLVDVITEQNKLYEEQAKLLDELAKKLAAPKGGAGGIGAIKPKFDLGDFIPAKLKQDWDDFIVALKKDAAAIAPLFQPTVDAINKRLLPAIDDLWQAVQDKLPKVEDEFAKTFAFMIQQSTLAGPTVVNNISDALDRLTDVIRRHGDEIIGAVGLIFRAAWTLVVLIFTDITASIATAFTLISGIWNLAQDALTGDSEKWHDDLNALWDEFWAIQLRTADTDLALLFNLFGLKWDAIKKQLEQQLAAILLDIAGWLSALHDAVVNAVTPIVNAIGSILSAAQGLYNWLAGHTFDFKINLPKLPPWAIPGSPTPFEMGLRGIANALRQVNAIAGPSLGGLSGLVAAPALAGGGGASYSHTTVGPTLTYAPTYNAPAPPPGHDQAIMRVWAR